MVDFVRNDVVPSHRHVGSASTVFRLSSFTRKDFFDSIGHKQTSSAHNVELGQTALV